MPSEESYWIALRDAVGDELGCRHITDQIRFEWSNRMSRTIGLAIQRVRNGKTERIIRINRDAWRFLEDHRKDAVIVHEVCHHTAGMHNRHNAIWQTHMVRCGYSPKVTTNMPEEYNVAVAHKRRTVKRYTVYCSCSKHELTKYQVERLHTLRCRKCKSQLHYSQLTI